MVWNFAELWACRNLSDPDDLRFGVYQEMLYATNTPAVDGAQWTGIVTQIAISMLESQAVDAVVCVQSAETDRFSPEPVCRGISLGEASRAGVSTRM
jgi:coenzyme F420-reducing hydrogenase beta subunit